MDMDEINSCKRLRSGGAGEGKIGRKGEEEEDGEADAGVTRTKPWHQHHSSRIFRVSRASGGKDRHSKVLTSKGLRDRRVRLAVSTAIQFYDLQDRLGYDQPSKAVEWLIKAASAAIAELPSLDATFPDLLNKHLEPEAGAEQQQQPQRVSHSRSGCSSTSETSKGSVLSLSRSEIRVKARERARERAAKDHVVHHHDGVNPGLDTHSSFTELLTGDGVQKQIQGSIFGQANYGNVMMMPPFGTTAVGDQQEMQQFPFMQEHLVSTALGDFSFNFGISPGLSGCNRGTLQSNSPSQLPNHHHHLQRFASPVDGSNLSFFFGGSGPESQFSAGLDGRLQLCYGNGYRHSDMKGKEKG